LSSQLQSSFATGSRMHGGRDEALLLAPLAGEPLADADALDPVPEADPYPFVFGATGTLQNVAVISSMQIVPVAGACEEGAC
jgi:hypothetical protein